MTRLVLLLALAAPAAAAQPRLAPADSVHIERLLDGMELERQSSSSLSRMLADPTTAGAVDRLPPGAFRQAVRAHLATGYTPARADALDAGIADGRYGATVDLALALESPDLMARLTRAMMAAPKKGTLGDSLDAVRFVRASGLIEYTRATLRDVFEVLTETVPILREEMEDSGRTLDETLDMQFAEIEPMYVLVVRTAPPGDRVRPATLAFAESDAGRYASEAVYGGMRDAFVPVLVEVLSASVANRMTDSERMDALLGEGERPVRVKPKPSPGE